MFIIATVLSTLFVSEFHHVKNIEIFQLDGDTNSALKQAYNLLQNVTETRPRVDSLESFGQDLFVLCAELAFQVRNTNIW